MFATHESLTSTKCADAFTNVKCVSVQPLTSECEIGRALDLVMDDFEIPDTLMFDGFQGVRAARHRVHEEHQDVAQQVHGH